MANDKDKKKQQLIDLVPKITQVLDKRVIVVTDKTFNGDNSAIISDKLKTVQNNN